ncbi:hypothetical protein [Chengkuizengella marina]|uniref:hypothetical protein n=1 Tax=Chengkuizengella marina TaxID=2507566 RepID=UPI001367F99D|nr:hypothetical protein [Chengkuizengella marina]
MNVFVFVLILAGFTVGLIVILEHVVRTAVDTSKTAADLKEIKRMLKSFKESQVEE